MRKRMNAHQQEKRALKIEARRTVAEQLGKAIGQTQYVTLMNHSLLARSFFGRFKWLLFGK